MLWSKCAICGSKKSGFIKEQEAKGILSNFGLKTPLSKIRLLGDIFFWMQFNSMIFPDNQDDFNTKWMK